MNDFTKTDIEKSAQLCIVAMHNLEQEESFKWGRPCLPKVNDYEEYCQLFEMINKVFAPPSVGMKFSDTQPRQIKYDIPERYRNE